MISLCLIVKPDDSEAVLLDNCLKSIAEHVDSIYITITGKNEKVEKVAKKYNANISYFEWQNDFAEARNFNFSQTKDRWVLWCDADDQIKGGELLKKAIERLEENGGDIGIMDYLYDFDKYGNVVVQHKKARLIKNDGCVKWVGKLHEDLIPQREVKQYYIPEIQIVHCSPPERKEEAKKRNLEIALLQLSDDPKTIWDVANAYAAVGNHPKAIEYYLKFIPETGSEEERFLAWHRLAGEFKEIEEYIKAIEAEWQAVKIRPWYPDAYLGLGEIYYRMGDPKRAKEFLIQGMVKEVPDMTAIVINPRDYDYNPLMILSRVYFQLNRPEDAKKCIQKCLEICPKNDDLKNTLKILDEEIKKLKAIDKIYEKALKCKTKEEIKKLIEEAPIDYQYHPKLIHLKNVHFTKTESSGRDLVFYCYQTEEPFNPDIVFKEGRGGSEEAVCHMSKRLADLGWNVVVYANCGHKEKRFGKVVWKPWWSFNPRDKQDILIVWRHPGIYEIKEINATKKYVWLHDVLKPEEFTKERLNKIDKIIALSKFQRDLFPDIPDEKFIISSNGIEPKMFEKNVKRNPYRMIYTSSYDRGLECLLKLFPFIKREVPEAELHIFYGWNLWDKMHSQNPAMQQRKAEMLKMMQYPGIYEHGRIPQERIIKEYQKSNILVYPTEFPEISFISGMKAQAAGCIPVTTTAGCLDETIQFGLKVDSYHIYSDIDAQKEWVEGVVNLLKNPPTEKEREPMMKWARKQFDWDKVAESWNRMLLQKKETLESVYMNRFEWIRKQCNRKEKIVDIGGNKGHTFPNWKNVIVVDIDDYSDKVKNFVRADAHKLPFKNKQFDTAVLAEILEHVDNPIQVLKEAKRVANKIIITVPNEYEWKDGLGAFMPAEEAARQQGLTVEEMAKKDNPAKELYSKDNYRHLHHQRYYTKEMLEEHLKRSGIKKYKIGKLYTIGVEEGFAFWTAICWLKF